MAVRRSRALIFVVLTLLLTGCSGGSAEPAPTARLAAGDREQDLGQVAEEGGTPAEELIRRWAEVEKDMLNTGETEEYAALTGPCTPCGRLAAQVRGLYEAGGYVSTDGMDIGEIRSVSDDAYEVEVTTGPSIEQRSAGAKPRRVPGGRRTYRLTLSASEGEGEGMVIAGLAPVG